MNSYLYLKIIRVWDIFQERFYLELKIIKTENNRLIIFRKNENKEEIE